MQREVFWLVPAAGFRGPLQKIIADLAAVQDGPVFEPHVTLGAVASGDHASLARAHAVLARTPPLVLTTSGVQPGSDFTHSLYLGFEDSDELDRLMAGFPVPAEHQPHLSLLYCVPDKRQPDACSAVHVPLHQIEFDEVWLVPMAGVVRSNENVTGWKPSERIRLSR